MSALVAGFNQKRRHAMQIVAELPGPSCSSAKVRRRLGFGQRVPGRKVVLPYIETHLVDHCNLGCRGCYHFSPLSPPYFAKPEVFSRDIERLAELFDVRFIRLLGGEPLLHPRVLDFAELARRACPTAIVSITSNGLLLGAMPNDFWRSLTSLRVLLRVSVYPDLLDTAAIARTAARYGTKLELFPVRSFRTMTLRLRGDGDAARNHRACRKTLHSFYNLRDGRIYPCPRIPYAPLFARHFDLLLPDGVASSVSIYDETDGYQISAFLRQPVDWCRCCQPEAVRYFPWTRSERQIGEWT